MTRAVTGLPPRRAVVVCLGDLVEDIVVSPVAPLRRGTDTDAQVLRRRGGSAANVAVNVAAAGGRARFVGAVGADPLGRMLTDALAASGVEHAVVRRGRTGTVVVVLDGHGERSFFSDRGAAVELDGLPRDALREVGVLHVPAYSFDGEPLATVARDAVRVARARAEPPMISIDASSVAVLERIGAGVVDELAPDVVFANDDEAAWFAGRLAHAALLVTKGGVGPTVLTSADGSHTEVAPSTHRSWADTTGAGDAFAAGFLVALLGGTPPERAVAAARRRAEHWLRSINSDDHRSS